MIDTTPLWLLGIFAAAAWITFLVVECRARRGRRS